MATAPNTFTPEEYLRLERESLEKHEYADGQMFATAGANRKHRRIAITSSLLWGSETPHLVVCPITLRPIVVSQDEVLVEQRVRLAAQEWRTRFFRSLEDSVALEYGGIVMALSNIYAGVKIG